MTTGLLYSSVLSLGHAAAQPSLAEAREQVSVWQGELNRATRSGDAAAANAARAQIRDWEAILNQRLAAEKREALLKKARENADKAEEIARLRGIKVPAHLKGDQRVMFIIRQDQIMEEQEKTAKEKALQAQLRGQLNQAITAGDYNRAKGFVSQGAKADIESVQLALNGGYTGIAYLLLKSNDKLLRADIDRALGKAMIQAAQMGSQDRINNLIKLGADPNYTEGNMTPMTAATRGGQMAAISALIAHGARRDPQELGKLLFQAVRKGDQNAAGNLIQMGASANYAEEGATALSTAIDAGNFGLANVLLNGGATPDPRVLGRALYRAVEQGREDQAAQLLKMGANVNYMVNSKAPLTVALDRQNMSMANLLINAGGDDPSGQYGRKLFDAALDGDMAWISILAKIEKYRNYRNGQGETPLHAAASRGNSQAVDILLAAGADPNALTVKNWGPIHHAARFGHKFALMQLLKGGADVYVVNSDGYDAYQLAAVAMKNSKNELDNGGILEYINLWRQYHPRGSSVAAK
ncbi:MAG: ankyrin repeat domain-containing protein [Thiolinea sp.]